MSESDNIRVNLYAVRYAVTQLENLDRYPMNNLMDIHVAHAIHFLNVLADGLAEIYASTPAEPCVDGDADMFEN